MFKNNSSIYAPEFFSYPGTLPNYKKWKPLLTGVATVSLWFIFVMILIGITCIMSAASGNNPYAYIESFRGGYDTMDNYSAIGALISMGIISLIIPALFLAMKLTKERPVSTLTSSRNGWSSDFFKKALLLSLVINGIPQIILAAAEGGFSHIDIKYTIPGFIIFAVLVPFQCMAEEYLFRGFIAQTIGSWFKKPVLTIIVSTIFFMVLHSYNGLGQLSVFVSGVVFCLTAYYTKGLEAGCAFHFVNNFFAFLLSGLGVSAVSSNTKISDMVTDILINVAFYVALVYMNKKKNWFKYDGVSETDNKAEECNVAS